MKKNHARRPIAWVLLAAAFALLVVALGCGGPKAATADNGAVNARQDTAAKPAEQTAKSAKPKEAKPEKAKASVPAPKAGTDGYTMRDIKGLRNTGNFARNALEHIFDGTINKKGKATGYHYSRIADSRGRILDGTRSAEDGNGVFTAKVEVAGTRKDGFSSFYPEDWTPQQVVDAINTAYQEAIHNPENPRGTLWIGHAGKLEIDMYLTDDRKILTAYPIFTGNKR